MSNIIGATYEVIREIGAGGGGIVYQANHLRLNKTVVLKADKRKLTTRPELLRCEVDVLKNLSHPYIPQVYDFFAEEETVYTAMEFIDGESLDKAIKREGRFPQPQVIRWAGQLLEALEYLHSPTHGEPPRGYVHSDIKPANLMRRRSGDICLIDFNISLALGEESVIGASAGYASPEHYGLDFSFSSTVTQDSKTAPMEDETATLTMSAQTSHRRVVPDVRSDIYSTGATLYHLLSGRRPVKDAMSVVPLSEAEASPPVAKIIAKAMAPNPDLRYQTAAEMRADFARLREQDPRTQRLRRWKRRTATALLFLFLAGGVMAFLGLKGMERDQAAARAAAETAQTALASIGGAEEALQRGDVLEAQRLALEALELDSPYTARAQKALTDSLGVYDLSDGFKAHLAIELPSPPLKLVLSPEGTWLAAVYAFQTAVFDCETGEKLAEFPMEPSALADVGFLDEDRLVFAGEGGVRAVDLRQGKEIWSGRTATALALSAGGTRVAAVNRDAEEAIIYNGTNGEIIRTVSFQGRKQSVAANDTFADPGDNLLALNRDGTQLAVSFDDGSLTIFQLEQEDSDLILLDPSDYVHFEGGFSGQTFAFSAFGKEDSLFAAIDTKEMIQTGGLGARLPFLVQADERGIFVALENVLVKFDPETGEQTEMAYTGADIQAFCQGGDYTVLAVGEEEIAFFDRAANRAGGAAEDVQADFLQIAGEFAAVGSRNTPVVRLLRLEKHPETELFSYDPSYPHDEARVSADRSTVMLFQYNAFRLYRLQGELLAEVELPDPEQVYDQQYRRDSQGSRLEVFYNDGTVRAYSAQDGTVLWEKQEEAADKSLYQEYFTDKLRITAPLHEAAAAYDRETGELIRILEQDDYLTYVTQAGEYVITEYVTSRGDRYGLLLDDSCEVLAKLPNLCDIWEDKLIFDYPSGNLRETRIYSLLELRSLEGEV